MTLPPFPTDASTLDLVDSALSADRTGSTSLGALLDILSACGGSDVSATADEETGVLMVRGPVYSADDVIRALVAEVRRLREG